MLRYFPTLFILLFSSVTAAQNIIYQVNGEKYEGRFAKKSASAPTVFIVHDWDGLTEYEVKRTSMLQELGYSVFAMDLFGKGVRPSETKERMQKTQELYKNRKKMRQLMNAAFREAGKLGLNTKNAVVIGYCFGGAAVLEWARSGVDLRAFVSFHGGLQTPEGQSYKNTRGEILVFHGSADQSVSLKDFAKLASELEEHKIDHEMITYGGAPHAFSVFGSERYRKSADQKSWSRLSSFLKEVTR